MRRVLAIVALGLALAAAGCVAPADVSGELGVENGYRYDADIAVTTADGLNASERDAVVGRAMARVEHIREMEFTDSVEVTVISRAEFRNQTGGGSTNLTTRQRWNEQVWEALHIIGEDATLPGSRSTNRGTSVVGYYSPSKNKIVLVSDSPTPMIDHGTLAHELVHALQDQRLNLGARASKQDKQLAIRGVVEGDANYVRALYEQRCGDSWECLERPPNTRTRPSDFNQGLFLVSYLPYVEGPEFVDAIRDRRGWDGVNDLYEKYPKSTEQLIHPSQYPRDKPKTVTVDDRSGGGWERFSNLSTPYDTVGEGSIYAMFVATGVIDRSGRDQYNYDHPLSAGWAGDRLVPYRDGEGQYGYVWNVRWETTGDAREFANGYRKLLDSYGAEQVGDGRYVVRTGDFADAFRITRDGKTVTIVNAPRRSQLDRIHAPA